MSKEIRDAEFLNDMINTIVGDSYTAAEAEKVKNALLDYYRRFDLDKYKITDAYAVMSLIDTIIFSTYVGNWGDMDSTLAAVAKDSEIVWLMEAFDAEFFKRLEDEKWKPNELVDIEMLYDCIALAVDNNEADEIKDVIEREAEIMQKVDDKVEAMKQDEYIYRDKDDILNSAAEYRKSLTELFAKIKA